MSLVSDCSLDAGGLDMGRTVGARRARLSTMRVLVVVVGLAVLSGCRSTSFVPASVAPLMTFAEDDVATDQSEAQPMTAFDVAVWIPATVLWWPYKIVSCTIFQPFYQTPRLFTESEHHLRNALLLPVAVPLFVVIGLGEGVLMPPYVIARAIEVGAAFAKPWEPRDIPSH